MDIPINMDDLGIPPFQETSFLCLFFGEEREFKPRNISVDFYPLVN